MQFNIVSALLAGAATVNAACTIPDTPLSNTIDYPFRVQVQNASVPAVHNKFMNLRQAGGGDHHLFIGPVGTPTFDLKLNQGFLQWNNIRAVIGGEVRLLLPGASLCMPHRTDQANSSPRSTTPPRCS